MLRLDPYQLYTFARQQVNIPTRNRRRERADGDTQQDNELIGTAVSNTMIANNGKPNAAAATNQTAQMES